MTPERALVTTLRIAPARAPSVRALSLEAMPADVSVVRATDAAGPLPTSVEGSSASTSRVQLGRPARGALEIVVRVRASAPTAAMKPTLGVDDGQVRIPGEAIPLPEPLEAVPVDLRFELGQIDHHPASGGSTLSASNVFRGKVSLGAVRHGYALLVDGDLGTATFHTFEGDDFAAWAGYTAFDPRWMIAESAGVRGAVDRYLGAHPQGKHAILLVSDRRKSVPFALVPRAEGLWISADIEAPWDATPLLRVSQHFAQKLIGAGLWIGEREGPGEAAGWFWSEGVSRVVGRESVFQLGLIGFDDIAADLDAALAETALSSLRAAPLDELARVARGTGDQVVEARRMLAARGILWASGLDARLRAVNKGSKDLREPLRKILRDAAEASRSTMSIDELASAIGASAGAEERAAFERVVVRGAPPENDLPAGAAGTCHELKPRKVSRFELGFEWTPASKPTGEPPPGAGLGAISAVTPSSAAERAGARVGDAIQSMTYTPGRVDVPVRLELVRAGKPVVVSFAPHGPTRDGKGFVRKKGAKDEACTR